MSDYEVYKFREEEEYEEHSEYVEDRDYEENGDDDGYNDGPINKDIIDRLYEDVVSVIYNNGYELHDTNLFKEDLTYFIYRLSKV